MIESDFRLRAANHCGAVIRKLGSGQEGYVWETTNKSAVKVFEREQHFNTELKCYQILQFHGVNEIEGFQIPELVSYSEEQLLIELTIVSAPYLLDFGKCRFSPPDYPSDAVEHYEKRCQDDFGMHWTRASAMHSTN